jgi:cellulose biosynthesis protein BcsE
VFGVAGTPAPVDTLSPGGIYALHVDTLPARLSLILQALHANLTQGTACALVTPLPLTELLARAREAGIDSVEHALESGRLKLFASIGDYTKNIFRFGPKRFLSELEQMGVAKGMFLILDHADNLFTLHDSALVLEQARAYHQWTRDQSHTALFLFLRPQQDAGLNDQYGLLSYMSGCAHFQRERDRFNLNVSFWHSPVGAAMGLTLPMHFDAQGQLAVGEALSAPAPASSSPAVAPKTRDEDDVYYMDADITELTKTQTRGRWTRVESLVGLLHETREAKAATLILHFGNDMPLQQLAEAVHTLRLNLGPKVRLVVRETNASLRYPNELLLLSLGANFVVHRDTALSRLPLVLESLRGQVTTREMNVSFGEALASVAPSKLNGPVSSGVFVDEACHAMRRALVLGVPCSLMVARLRDDVTTQTIKKAFALTRAGDLLTVHGQECLVFLQACPAENARATLERLAGRALAELFSDVRLCSTGPAIGAEIDKLRQAINPQAAQDGVTCLSRPPSMRPKLVTNNEKDTRPTASEAEHRPPFHQASGDPAAFGI